MRIDGCRVRPGFPSACKRQTFTGCRWASTCHDLPSRKRADHPVCGLSVEASRIALLHARLQFFSAALFLDGPGLLCRQGGQPKINSLLCGAGAVTWRPPWVIPERSGGSGFAVGEKRVAGVHQTFCRSDPAEGVHATSNQVALQLALNPLVCPDDARGGAGFPVSCYGFTDCVEGSPLPSTRCLMAPCPVTRLSHVRETARPSRGRVCRPINLACALLRSAWLPGWDAFAGIDSAVLWSHALHFFPRASCP
ncbi:hypothetical protein DR66_2360 [Delftia acidovorans]|nr:hypothetical protein DR66_2360 [Delftia acidovorans]